MTQDIIALSLVAGAAVYLGLKVLARFRAKAGCAGGCGCAVAQPPAPATTARRALPVVRR